MLKSVEFKIYLTKDQTENFQLKYKTETVLLYGVKTWRGTKHALGEIQNFTNRYLRRILGICWQDMVRIEDLRKRANQEPMLMQVKRVRRRWMWLGHTLRRSKSSIARQYLQWNPQAKRPRGRPRVSWQRTVVEEIKAVGFNWETLWVSTKRSSLEVLCRWPMLLSGAANHANGLKWVSKVLRYKFSKLVKEIN